MQPTLDELEIPQDDLLNTVVASRYHVRSILGEGGMGVVYEAYQEELERAVAVKVIRREYASTRTVVERFLREARSVGALGHPNIVDIYDVGRLADGRPFMVMPKLVGFDLTELLHESRELPGPARVAELLLGPAAALDLMHARGMVHRDLKPENLYLVRLSNGEELVKIVDFGLAALMDRSESRITRVGLVTGTPQYMAPEATSGDLPDGRGDVYSLAVIAFELLAGVPPFDHPDPLTLLVSKRERVAPTLRDLAVRSSPALEAVIAKALSRDPAARHATAGAFVADLRRAAAEMELATPVAAIPLAAVPIAAGETPEDTAVAGAPAAVDGKPMATPTHDADGRIHTEVDVPVALVGARPIGRWVAGAAIVLLALGLSLGDLFFFPGDDAPTSAVDPTPSANPLGTGSTPGTGATSAEPPGSGPTELAEAAPPREAAASEPANAPVAIAPVANAPTANAPTANAPVANAPVANAPVVNAPAVPATDGPAPDEPAAEPRGARTTREAPRVDEARAQRSVEEGTRALLSGRVPAAMSAFRDATLAAPRHAPAWRGLGLASERLGRRTEAASAYRRYLRLAPGAADATTITRRLTALEAP